MKIKQAGMLIALLALLVPRPAVATSAQVKWRGTTAKEGDVTHGGEQLSRAHLIR